MEEQPPRRQVTPSELRRRFNDGGIEERANAGEFRRIVARDSHPSLEGSTEPFCIRSQILSYVRADGERIAIVHRYLRQDGSIGGSGRPDPKMLLDDDGILYVLKPERPSTPG